MPHKGGYQHNFRNIVLLNIIIIAFVSFPVYAQEETTIFIPQPGTPVGIPNFAAPELACQWAGVGGQVFDRNGNPLTGLVVQVEGEIGGQPILVYAVTGGSAEFGPGGYLIQLADLPVKSSDLSLKITDITGSQISQNLQLTTYDECSKNLLLVNVREHLISHPIYLPYIHR